MIKVYEAWGQNDESPSVVFGESNAIDEDRKSGVLTSAARLLHRFEAKTWEEAMTIHHELMGWEPYKPIGELAFCPHDCGATFYPDGSGECPNCGKVC
jgi:hypothetical protein